MCIVTTKAQALQALKALSSPASLSAIHACDTEVMAIDLSAVGPVGNGIVTCLSMYSGPDFDYGLGGGPGTALWIDNLDESEGILNLFADWFADERFKKAWHNYGFDRHVLFNMGIDCKGFGGDTMHMARLQDTGRAKWASGGGYSLEALTEDLLGRRKKPMKEIFGKPRLKSNGEAGAILDLPPVELMQRERDLRKKWIAYSAYDAEGTWLIHQALQNKLQAVPWIKGKNLYDFYQMYLIPFGELLTDMERRGVRVDADAYLMGIEAQAREDKIKHSAIFRNWASTLIGADGLAMNPNSAIQISTFLFGGCPNPVTNLLTDSVKTFKVPREEIEPEAIAAYKKRDEEALTAMSPEDRPPPAPEKDQLDLMTLVQLKVLCSANKLPQSGAKADLQLRIRDFYLSSGGAATNTAASGGASEFSTMSVADLRDACVARGLSDKGIKAVLQARLREDSEYAGGLLSSSSTSTQDGYKSIADALAAAVHREREAFGGNGNSISSIMEEIKGKDTAPKFIELVVRSIGMTPEKYTEGGAPSATADVLKKLAGDDPFHKDRPAYGRAYEFFGGGKAGHDACVALFSLTQMGSIDTMIGNFLVPLQTLADDQSRVHCSLNLNTETGRLSARRPNLQNQPALEKDSYKIRKAFQASPGNKLIVADYGQLELRLLASMTNCDSMIKAFSSGGDFHSRTAMGMFPYIKEKVENGDVLFEWDNSKGKPPKPLLKDEFGSERRKAKTLNFGIAYGKTAHGLSKDWGVSVQEAEGMLKAWYADRPEVLAWQKAVMSKARKDGLTRTLMGRYRHLPDAMSKNRQAVGHAERASINAPIQGGAADVAMMAMIKINNDERLKKMGWILLLQIHDEVILEGPEETAEEALKVVFDLMQNPWGVGLEQTKVALLVDGSFADNWYEAK